MIIEKSESNMQVVPHYVAGKHVSAYRRHKLEGTLLLPDEWRREHVNTPKPLGYNAQLAMGVFMYPVTLIGWFATGQAEFAAMFLFMTLLLGSIAASESATIQAKYANARIARARVDSLKLYALEGPVVDALSIRMSCAEASRMIDWLDQDVSRELHQAFVDYHDRYDLALETIDAVEASTIDSGVKLAKLAMLHDKAAGFADEAVAIVRGIFAEHDAVAELEEAETRELVESKRFAELEVAKINQKFANESLLKQVDYVLSL